MAAIPANGGRPDWAHRLPLRVKTGGREDVILFPLYLRLPTCREPAATSATGQKATSDQLPKIPVRLPKWVFVQIINDAPMVTGAGFG